MNIIEIIKSPYIRFNNEVSGQDLLKAAALFIMVIDHLGVYFYPEYKLFRSIGRTTLPVWFFFVGYNFKSQNLYFNQLVFLAITLEIISYLLGEPIFPLSALFSMFICRIVLSYYEKVLKSSFLNLFEWFIIAFFCLIGFYLVNFTFEYGTLGILMSIWGYNARLKDKHLAVQSLSIAFIIFYTQISIFRFDLLNSAICIALVGLTILLLHNYKHRIFNINGVSKYIINISSRYTLYIYFLHLIIFIIIRKVLL